MIHLCELFILEVKVSDDPNLWEEAKNQIQQLYIQAQDQRLFTIIIEALILKARLATVEGELQQTLEYYDKALQTIINPKALGEVHSELGICHIMKDDFDRAVHHWEKAIEWDLERKEAYVNLATAHEERGLLAKAISYLNRVKKIDPDYYFAHRSLGRIFISLGQWRKAVEEFLSIIEADPENAWAHYCLGNCYYQDGILEKAKKHLNMAIKLDPKGEAGRCASRELRKIRI